MLKDYSNKNLQKASFVNQDLSYARFSGSDLRGADFTGCNLSGTDFTNTKTGISTINTFLIFLFALVVSAISGYMAMLSGSVIQAMLASNDQKIRIAAIVTIVLIFSFIIYCYRKGAGRAIRYMLVPVIIISIILGASGYFSGLGTGKGMLYQILALLLVVIMLLIGTVARVAAGSLSNILFIVVALSGGIFGKSVGGEIGAALMAVSCAVLSKRALSGAEGFKNLNKIAQFITARFGTSFRKCNMSNADFSHTKTIRNADFSNADISFVHWGEAKKMNCIS